MKFKKVFRESGSIFVFETSHDVYRVRRNIFGNHYSNLIGISRDRIFTAYYEESELEHSRELGKELLKPEVHEKYFEQCEAHCKEARAFAEELRTMKLDALSGEELAELFDTYYNHFLTTIALYQLTDTDNFLHAAQQVLRSLLSDEEVQVMLRDNEEFYEDLKWKLAVLEKKKTVVDYLLHFPHKCHNHYDYEELEEHYLEEFAQQVPENVHQEIAVLEKESQDLAAAQAKIVQKHLEVKLPAMIIRKAGQFRFRLKKYWAGYEYLCDPLWRAIGARLAIPLEDIVWTHLSEELKDCLRAGKPLAPEEIARRKKGFALLLINGEKSFTTDVDKVEATYLQAEQEQEVRGTCAHPGHVEGTILNIPVTSLAEFSEAMEEAKGDILVTPMTQPYVVPYLKRFKAIVTDQGGIVCHAAIISREYRIPCVVGTSNATELLKTGDKVRVEADKGVVRKL